MVLLVRQLVGEQCETEAAPGCVRLAEERGDAERDDGKAVRRQLRKRSVQGFPPLRRVELGRESLRGDRVEIELTMRVAACGEHKHRATSRTVQLVSRNRQVGETQPDERDEQLT